MSRTIINRALLLLSLLATLALAACGGGVCVENEKGEVVCTVPDEPGEHIGSASQAMTKADLIDMLKRDTPPPPSK
ncbi:MAG: hypothetical protein KC503_00905 [Myxococcales bacterium]|nr:hypothetical protein [Myxococcales bacterium]